MSVASPSPAPASPAVAPREALAGLVERVTFHGAESGFGVLRVRARRHREAVAVVGHAAGIAVGEWVTASGEWVNDRAHGLQFRAAVLRIAALTSLEGIERYLASGLGPRASCAAWAPSTRAHRCGPLACRCSTWPRSRPSGSSRCAVWARVERIAAAWAERKAMRAIKM